MVNGGAEIAYILNTRVSKMNKSVMGLELYESKAQQYSILYHYIFFQIGHFCFEKIKIMIYEMNSVVHCKSTCN